MGPRSPCQGGIIRGKDMPGLAQRHPSVSCPKMAEPINLPFGLWTLVGRRKHKFNHIPQVSPMSPHERNIVALLPIYFPNYCVTKVARDTFLANRTLSIDTGLKYTILVVASCLTVNVYFSTLYFDITTCWNVTSSCCAPLQVCVVGSAVAVRCCIAPRETNITLSNKCGRRSTCLYGCCFALAYSHCAVVTVSRHVDRDG